MSDSLQPHGLQHARLPCSSPTPGACSNSCPSSWWCIQPSHTLSSPSPPAFNCPQNQGLPQWLDSSNQRFIFSNGLSKKYSGFISFRICWLDLLLSKELSRESVAQQPVTNTSAFSWGIVVGSLQDGPRRFLHSVVHTLCSSALQYTRIALQDHSIQQKC